MTAFIVRKLGVPGREELAMGALAEGNVCIMSEMLVEQLGISDEEIHGVVEKEKEECSIVESAFRIFIPVLY